MFLFDFPMSCTRGRGVVLRRSILRRGFMLKVRIVYHYDTLLKRRFWGRFKVRGNFQLVHVFYDLF
jgi:hypothetical protein